MQEILVSNEKYSLSMSVIKQEIKFILVIFGGLLHRQVYQAAFSSIYCHEELPKYFQQLQDLVCHLRNLQNFQVNLQTKQISIFLNINSKKARKVEIAKIALVNVQEDLQAELKHIIERCNQKSQLDERQVLTNMITMTKILNLVIKNQKQKNRSTETHYQISDQSESVVGENLYIECQSLLKNKEGIKKQNPITRTQFNKFESKYNEQVSKIEKKVEQINGKYVNLDQFEEIISKMGFFGERIQTIFQRISKIQNNIEQNIQLQDIKNKRIKASQWVDSQSYYFSGLNFTGRIVTNASNGAKMVFGNKKPRKYKSFSICFTKVQAFSGVGLVDSSYKTRLDWSNLDNLIIYGSGGLCSIGSKQFGPPTKGYIPGQLIQVQINYQEGVIEWIADGQIRQIAQSPNLKNQSIDWVPIIYFQQKFDSVMILK